MTKRQYWVSAGAVLAGLAVMLGAFAAHGLKNSLPPAQLSAFQTGVSYQFYHALALIALGALSGHTARRSFTVAGYAWLTGVVLFSGSLYAMAVFNLTALGPVTPVGGLCFIAGWLSLAVGAWRSGL